MKITVQAFAGLRERLKFQRREIEIDADATAATIFSTLVGGGDEAARLMRSTLFAVNRRHVRPDCALHDGDELALIPPVAGG